MIWDNATVGNAHDEDVCIYKPKKCNGFGLKIKITYSLRKMFRN